MYSVLIDDPERLIAVSGTPLRKLRVPERGKTVADRTVLNELVAAVQYRRTEGDFDLGWHTLAAFDVKRAAEQYRDQCAPRSGYEWRVVELT